MAAYQSETTPRVQDMGKVIVLLASVFEATINSSHRLCNLLHLKKRMTTITRESDRVVLHGYR
jgi:hypothetical protein